MSDELPPLLQACPSCASLLDVSEQEPFSSVHCPICGQSLRARTQFNNFTIQEPIGSGGMGAVYRALDVNLNRLVALKVVKREFSANPEYVENFEREAIITASVNDPHVVKVFSFGSDRGTYYIAMELVDKGSLDSLISLQGTVAESQVLQVGIQIATGLNAALKLGLIHRDVKPGNILFADANTAKIVDFGLALLLQEGDDSGDIWGTPYYIAPEKLNRQPEDFRSDIYSLGGTLFHALAGRPPFEAETASMVALKHLKSHAVSLQSFAPDVSSPTSYVINRMLEKEPDARYQSYEELIEHLTYARMQLLESRARPRQAKQVVVESKSEHLAAMVIAILLVVAIGVIGFLGWKYRDNLFPAPALTAEQIAEQQQKEQLGAARQRYDELRATMLAGDYSSAQQGFHDLANSPTPPAQPLLNWSTFHEGLCALLGEKLSDARGIFDQLQDRGMYSTEERDAALANFFVETGRQLAKPTHIPPQEARTFPNGNLDSLTLFACALKDYQMKEMEAAAALFAASAEGKKDPAYAWITDYQKIASSYQSDLALYLGLVKEADAASTPEQQRAVVEKIRASRDQLKNGGKIQEAMTDLQARAQSKAQGASSSATKPEPAQARAFASGIAPRGLGVEPR